MSMRNDSLSLSTSSISYCDVNKPWILFSKSALKLAIVSEKDFLTSSRLNLTKLPFSAISFFNSVTVDILALSWFWLICRSCSIISTWLILLASFRLVCSWMSSIYTLTFFWNDLFSVWKPWSLISSSRSPVSEANFSVVIWLCRISDFTSKFWDNLATLLSKKAFCSYNNFVNSSKVFACYETSSLRSISFI